jgi:hypothetical protein
VTRPAVEVADILHAQGDHLVEPHPWLSVQQRSVLRAITRGRTAALGGHVDHCNACGHRAISYNSCRHRHCPTCQAQARARWLAAREQDVLDVSYVHVVFTLPHSLLPLGSRNAARLRGRPYYSPGFCYSSWWADGFDRSYEPWLGPHLGRSLKILY